LFVGVICSRGKRGEKKKWSPNQCLILEIMNTEQCDAKKKVETQNRISKAGEKEKEGNGRGEKREKKESNFTVKGKPVERKNIGVSTRLSLTRGGT